MSDRNEHGRFVVGNRASPGRPRRITENKYLGRLTELLTPEKWDKIVNKAIADATKGSATARAWLSDYVIGRPATTISLVASEQVLLSEVLKRFQANGFTAGDVFEVMLQQMAESDVKTLESGVTNG